MSYVKRKGISTIVAYMVGTNDDLLESNYGDCSDVLLKLRDDKCATIIRYLSRIRTSLMKNFKRTDEELKFSIQGLSSMEWFDAEEIKQLEDWGISIHKANYKATDYTKHINKLIDSKIDDTRSLFPTWLEWSYVRGLFVITGYNSQKRMIDEYEKFRAYVSMYPYSMYIYWSPFECSGLIKDDSIFLRNLYEMNGSTFTDRNKYIELDSSTSGSIEDFILESSKVVIAVDCENSDIYKLYSFLKSLPRESIKKISKVILFDDVNTVDTWKLLEKFIDIPVEYSMVERVLARKSLVDIKMTAGICHSHYKENVDAFIVVASDSDYLGVMSALPDARFMFMYENKKSSSTVIEELSLKDILSCSLDEMYSGDGFEVKDFVLQSEMGIVLSRLEFDLNEELDRIVAKTRMTLSKEERAVFYKKCAKGLKASVSKEGVFTVKLK